jgi:hypothetical protein
MNVQNKIRKARDGIIRMYLPINSFAMLIRPVFWSFPNREYAVNIPLKPVNEVNENHMNYDWILVELLVLHRNGSVYNDAALPKTL